MFDRLQLCPKQLCGGSAQQMVNIETTVQQSTATRYPYQRANRLTILGTKLVFACERWFWEAWGIQNERYVLDPPGLGSQASESIYLSIFWGLIKPKNTHVAGPANSFFK